jgi:hypothetical protein
MASDERRSASAGMMVRPVVIPITDSRQSPVYVERVCKYLIGSNYAKEFAYRLVAQPLAEKDEKAFRHPCNRWDAFLTFGREPT